MSISSDTISARPCSPGRSGRPRAAAMVLARAVCRSCHSRTAGDPSEDGLAAWVWRNRLAASRDDLESAPRTPGGLSIYLLRRPQWLADGYACPACVERLLTDGLACLGPAESDASSRPGVGARVVVGGNRIGCDAMPNSDPDPNDETHGWGADSNLSAGNEGADPAAASPEVWERATALLNTVLHAVTSWCREAETRRALGESVPPSCISPTTGRVQRSAPGVATSSGMETAFVEAAFKVLEQRGHLLTERRSVAGYGVLVEAVLFAEPRTAPAPSPAPSPQAGQP